MRYHFQKGEYLSITKTDSGTCQLRGNGAVGQFLAAYGVSRRISSGSLSETKNPDPSATLFDENESLMNAEEWFLQADYAAKAEPASNAAAGLARVKSLLCGGLLPGVTDLRPHFTLGGAAHAEVLTGDGWIRMSDLSSGYKSVIAWMTDLAARLAEHYPNSPNPLAEPGVVLVDQIDLYLHPKWQRSLMEKLTSLFPRVQWIVSAHSPLIAQAVPDVNIALLRRVDGSTVIEQDHVSVKGWRVDQILSSELFEGVPARDAATEALLAERKALLSQPTLSESDQTRLREIKSQLAPLWEDQGAEGYLRELLRKAEESLRVPA